MSEISQDKKKSNVRLAIFFGIIAAGFFILGMYLMTGKAAG